MHSKRAKLQTQAFRTRRKQFLGHVSEALSPALRLASRAMSRRESSPPSEWRRGLILSHNHIGDVLYRTCSLDALHAGLPECRWTYLTSHAGAEILKGNPALDELLPWAEGDDAWDVANGSFRQLRARDFDVAICTNSVRYYPDLLLATALGIPNRVAFTHKGLSGLVTHPVPIEIPRPYPEYFRAIVASLTDIGGDPPLRPRVHLDAEDQAAADAVFQHHGLNNRKPVVACSVTSRQRGGTVQADWLIDLLVEARREVEFSVFLFGVAADRELLLMLSRRLGDDVAVVAGELNIRGIGAALRKCALLLAVDSGPRHLGNAIGLPVFFTPNLFQSRVETGTYCETETDVLPEGEFLSEDQISSFLRSAPTANVVSAIVSVLKRSGPRE